MATYRISKQQVKRLLSGGYVQDGHGRKLLATDNVKEVIKTIDDNDLYDKVDILLKDGMLDVRRREGLNE